MSLLIILSCEQSCQKIDTTDLGVGLIPEVDNVNTFETILDVITDNSYMPESDSITRSEDHALGVMTDPEFGTTTANIYFEILPPTAGTYPFGNFDSTKIIDSVILSLSYKSIYGDSMSKENFGVYEIAQSANFKDSVYRTNYPDFDIVATPLAMQQVDFTTLNDPQRYKQAKDTNIISENNVLRIRLNRSLGERLAAYNITNAYKSDTAFREFFKGIAIKADGTSSSSKKALAYFSIADVSKTRLSVYYRIKTNGTTDTAFTDFTYRATQSTRNPMFVANRSANFIKRDVIGTNYSNNVTGSLQEKLYIQSGPGSFATIHVPGLKTLANSLIHKAELIIEKLPSVEDNVFAPPILFLDLIDSFNNRFITIQNDLILDNQQNYNVNEFGGIIRNDMYAFDISRHVQGILSRKNPVYTFRLHAPYITSMYYTIPGVNPNTVSANVVPFQVNGRIAAGRVVTGGAAHPTKKARVRIIYSKI